MNVNRGRELAEALKASGIRKHYTIQTRSDIIVQVPASHRAVARLRADDHLHRSREGRRRRPRLGQQEQHGGEQRSRDRDPARPRRRLHAQLHRRSELGPRGLRQAQALDRPHRRLQQRLLGAHAASRHRPLGRRQARRQHRGLGALRHRAHGAADQAPARRVLPPSTPASGSTRSTCVTRPRAG